ncbi:DUF3467 domain-containing protein [Bradyrhizobium sp. GCM10027634]|uniref:DUF3467 domain-containing protein n=1 Tax=unclassified Bradyrhizobium TaxID=2631580 RepID=UPI00263A7644|nr:DUF3467 domain-containing protein [Bradyrhizobium sp. WYCCWR 12677]MDN5005281.1 hypothetical protein [Bradyrhizobium sp. WYCCWR 12677]
MAESDGARSGSKDASTAGPTHMTWDTSRRQSHDSTLATATATQNEVILNFGAKRSQEAASGEVVVELLRRIALKPLTAKHLADTLQRVIVAYDTTRADNAGGGSAKG